LIWRSLTAWLYDRPSAGGVAVAEALATASPDRLTRLLPADWSGHTLLDLTVRRLVVWARGALMIDETVRAQPWATTIDGLAWGFASRERRPVYGFPLGLLVWPNGPRRLPLGIRLWHNGGPSTSVLAREWLSDARHRLRCRPEAGLCDAWYPSTALRTRIRDDGWYGVCRLKKNRRCKGHAVRAYRRHPSWAARGGLSGGLKGRVVSYGATYDATNRLPLPAVEVRRHDRMRAPIDAVIRACQDQRGLGGCQARSERAQRHHLPGCCVAFCVLERERHARQLSLYQRKRQLSFRGHSSVLPALERLRSTA
jgi:hypothetical protein